MRIVKKKQKNNDAAAGIKRKNNTDILVEKASVGFPLHEGTECLEIIDAEENILLP